MLAQEALGAAQRAGGDAYYDDVEATLDFARAGLFGLDVTKQFHYLRDDITVEDLFDKSLPKVLKGKDNDSPPSAFVIDSLTALSSATELEESMTDSTYGATKARQMSRAFRKYIWAINQANIAIIFVDQTRDAFGGWGKKYEVSGGKSLRFYASTRVLLEHIGTIINSAKKPVGIKVRFKVEKNKIAPPFRDGVFRLLFDIGIDDVATNFEWLRDNSGVVVDNDEEEYTEGEPTELPTVFYSRSE